MPEQLNDELINCAVFKQMDDELNT